MSFGTRLRERREWAGLTQKELGAILGVSGNAVGNYENGVSSPNADSLYKLFDVLKCDANFLFQDEVNEKQPAPEVGDRLSDAEEQFFTEFRKLPESHKGLAADLCTALVRELVKHQTIEIEAEDSVPARSGR